MDDGTASSQRWSSILKVFTLEQYLEIFIGETDPLAVRQSQAVIPVENGTKYLRPLCLYLAIK